MKKRDNNDALIAQFLDRVPVIAPDSTAHSLAIRAVAMQVDNVLELKQVRFKECFSNMDTLRHFQDTITPTIISHSGREIMRGKMIRLALEVFGTTLSISQHEPGLTFLVQVAVSNA